MIGIPRKNFSELTFNAARHSHGLDPEKGLRRLFGISGHFVSLPPSPPKPDTAKAPGTAGFGGFHGLDLGLPEKEWWAREDSNLQPDRYERPALTS